jgi:hypothetical protein
MTDLHANFTILVILGAVVSSFCAFNNPVFHDRWMFHPEAILGGKGVPPRGDVRVRPCELAASDFASHQRICRNTGPRPCMWMQSWKNCRKRYGKPQR